MVELTALWLPVVVSAVVVFIASSLIHVVLPWHKGDYPGLEKEDEFRAAVGPLALPPGDYMTPRANSTADMKSPEYNEKMKQGPVIIMTVLPNGPATMGAAFIQWFLFLLAVGLFAARGGPARGASC
jgi:hypothetical protein